MTTDIRVPRLNSLDTTFTLTDWLVDDGEQVSEGDPVAVVETSKAAEELVAEAAGVMHRLVPERAECRAGQVIGRLFGTDADRRAFSAAAAQPATGPGSTDGAGPGEPVITDAALALADENGIDIAQLRELGPALVRRVDVERLVAGGGDLAARTQVLPASQRAVAAAVAESHRTVPAAYVAVRVRVAAALAYARAQAAHTGLPIGLPDLVIRAVAARRAAFPLFFAAPRDDGSVTVGGAHVGVTVDVGKGLFVPVVRDAAELSWAELSALLMRFRIAAMRGTFRASDLAGGTITVALHTGGTVVQAVPIVFPGQTCVVSLCAVRDELRLTGTGQVIVDPVVDIGLSYDHRVVNGRACVEFLTAVQADLEDP